MGPPRPCERCGNASKYACPRCSAATCSLECSRTHKMTTGCSGQRDRSAYVAPNKYSLGTLMDDYAYLEDISRRSAEWGKEVLPELKRERERDRERERESKRFRSMDPASAEPVGSKSKLPLTLDLGRKEAELGRFARRAGIKLMRMPRGMDRRKLNRTKWDNKSVFSTVFLCICRLTLCLFVQDENDTLDTRIRRPRTIFLFNWPAAAAATEARCNVAWKFFDIVSKRLATARTCRQASS
jgi:hypothetical protein